MCENLISIVYSNNYINSGHLQRHHSLKYSFSVHPEKKTEAICTHWPNLLSFKFVCSRAMRLLKDFSEICKNFQDNKELVSTPTKGKLNNFLCCNRPIASSIPAFMWPIH